MKPTSVAGGYEFRLPDLGEGIGEAQILCWHVQLGGEVREGDPLLDVETDKANVQIPSPASGRLAVQQGRPGEIIQTGALLAVIGGASPSLGTRPAPARVVDPLAAAGPKAGAVFSPLEGMERGLAGAGGIPYLELRPLPDFSCWGPVERRPVLSVRRQMARRTVTSATLIPHASAMDEADITALEERRRQANIARAREGGQPLTLLPHLIKLVAGLLRMRPAFNASFDPFREEIIHKKYYHIRVTMASERGLLAPVVRAVDTKSLEELGLEIRGLSQRAGAGELLPEELQGGTFTVSSLGSRGVRWAMPTIYYPEAAILVAGRPQDQAVVRGGQIVVRKMLPLTLAFDHRVADGSEASDFLNEFVQLLEADPAGQPGTP